MQDEESATTRHMGLGGATGVGVGAIVGGGIFVLAGVAFQATGPSAILAFAANGVIALITALSFAEMASAFPESGGAYVFAKKVLTVRAAFAVGWVLWFAYIVAGVLYAVGFAEYAAAVAADLWRASLGAPPPSWLVERPARVGIAVAVTAGYAVNLIRKQGGGGQWETVGKLVIFVVLVGAGAIALGLAPDGTVSRTMIPFLPRGFGGLLQAMGFTFIALQGFDLIAAVAGEVKEPERNVPRAMFASLGTALVIYLPLLFIVASVGPGPGEAITQMSAASPATVMADAARQFAGAAGYWMVMVAALLATMSALAANMLAASHVALTMASDRTLPRVLAKRHPSRNTPVMAVYATSLALVVIILILPDVSAAGAAASLIFLIAFALVHATSYLARRRALEPAPFRAPLFPLVPIVGGGACAALAVFQALAVPSAGGIVAVWLGLGVILFMSVFSDRAHAVDAFTEALDPQLAALRGRSPLVLVPLANPSNAARMATIGNALAAPHVGRVVLLTVVQPTHPDASAAKDVDAALRDAERIVHDGLSSSLAAGHAPEALITVAADPWEEVVRVVRARGCESLLVGLSIEDQNGFSRLEGLLNRVECDVVIWHAPASFELGPQTPIVVAVGGRGSHDDLRARLLGSLGRSGYHSVRFVRIVSADTPADEQARLGRDLAVFAKEETGLEAQVEVIATDDVVTALSRAAGEGELLVLGLQRHRGRRFFGEVAIRVARQTASATILISRR